MAPFTRLLSLAAMGLVLSPLFVSAQSIECSQTVLRHIGAENSEDLEEEGEVAYQRSEQRRPWYYHHQDYSDLDPREEVDYALDDETEWPSHREDFSDYLMRDKHRDW
jgi:hypothetical protein